MSNATHTIIGLFGGVSALAKAVGRTPSTVDYWRQTGRIPEKNRDEVAKALRVSFPSAVDEVVARAIAGQ